MFVFTLERIDDYTPAGTVIDVTRKRAEELFSEGKIGDPAVDYKIHQRKFQNMLAFTSSSTIETEMELSDNPEKEAETMRPPRKAKK